MFIGDVLRKRVHRIVMVYVTHSSTGWIWNNTNLETLQFLKWHLKDGARMFFYLQVNHC